MSKLMTNLQIIQREKFCQGSRRRSRREICCFGAYLLGTVLSPLLRQKMRRRKALAAMAMTDDVTKPAPINQWVSASIYRGSAIFRETISWQVIRFDFFSLVLSSIKAATIESALRWRREERRRWGKIRQVSTWAVDKLLMSSREETPGPVPFLARSSSKLSTQTSEHSKNSRAIGALLQNSRRGKTPEGKGQRWFWWCEPTDSAFSIHS
jgi:hypothetical protein